MKKLGLLAAAVCIGTTVAVASTVSIPWFVDNAPAGNKIPGLAEGVTGIVTLKSNLDTDLVCEIFYFTQSGVSIGPGGNTTLADSTNTFILPARASLAFRPAVPTPDPPPVVRKALRAFSFRTVLRRVSAICPTAPRRT